MSTDYFIEVFHNGHAAWLTQLQTAVAGEVRRLGIHRSVRVEVRESHVTSDPAVGVYFGSTAGVCDVALVNRLERAVAFGRPVIPVVSSLGDLTALVPAVLRPLNGWEWSGSGPADRLARRLLEELGIEDRRRRAFISHKREDGMAAAQQLHDFLSHNGFDPFIDRFGIGLGHDVQGEIADALEDCAFLLLLETPLAHESEWVYDEVEYAQSHQMGMHIVTWPGTVEELPATNRWPRQKLDGTDLRLEKGYDVFTDAMLEKILEEVEAVHADAIVRRRRYLLRSAEDAAKAAGLNCTPLEGWRLLVGTPATRSVVQVSARLPTVDDLFSLDAAKESHGGSSTPGVLVHSARMLSGTRLEMLAWATGSRDLTLLPENAVGGYWN